jgi:hypothetical protein
MKEGTNVAKRVTLSEAALMFNKSKIMSNNSADSSAGKKFALSEAIDIAKRLGVDFEKVDFSPEEYLEGINIELEHGTVSSDTNVTNDDPLATGKIALAHLNETPLYYHQDIGIEAWEHAIKALRGDPKGKKIRIL